MPLIAFLVSQLQWVRVAALMLTCMAFTVAALGAELRDSDKGGWCIFCWAFSFACTLLVLLGEHCGLRPYMPYWPKLSFSIACNSAVFCFSASVAFPVIFLHKFRYYDEVHIHRVISTVFSCLATVAYIVEVILSKARQRMPTDPVPQVPIRIDILQSLPCVRMQNPEI